jgi:hypothetical protein
MNHCGLCSTRHNRSYSEEAREPTAFHRIFFLSLDFPYFSLVLVLDFQNVLGNKKNKYLRYSFKEDKYGKA